jgi:hypothetical protein
VEVSCVGGGNRITRRKLPTCRKSRQLMFCHAHYIWYIGFLLLPLGLYLCWWIISPWGGHLLSSQCFTIDMVYKMHLLLKFTVPKNVGKHLYVIRSHERRYIWWVGNIIFMYEIRCFIMFKLHIMNGRNSCLKLYNETYLLDKACWMVKHRSCIQNFKKISLILFE